MKRFFFIAVVRYPLCDTIRDKSEQSRIHVVDFQSGTTRDDVGKVQVCTSVGIL